MSSDLRSRITSCFREGFSFKWCCTRAKPRGEPECWDSEFTFEYCCKLPIPSPASALLEDQNCLRPSFLPVAGGVDWHGIRQQLLKLTESLTLGVFGQEFGQEGATVLLRRWSATRHPRVGCSIGRLTLVVAQVLLCTIAGDGHECRKYWDHAAQVFQNGDLDVVRWSATTWPLINLLTHLGRVVQTADTTPECQEVEGSIDWPLVYRASQDLGDEHLANMLWRMASKHDITLDSMMDSNCRGGAQLLLLMKLGFCMDMSPICVVSHTYALETRLRKAAVSGAALRDWLAEAGAWNLFDVSIGSVKKHVRHRYDLGLSVEELQQLGVLGERRLSGCLQPSFPSAKGDERYYLLDPKPGLADVALNSCRALCGTVSSRSYGALPEIEQGAFRGIPCVCSPADDRVTNCTDGEVPLFPMPDVQSRHGQSGKFQVLSQASEVASNLDRAVPVFVTMVFGKMARYIEPFTKRVRRLAIPNIVVFALDELAEDACRRNGVLFVRGMERTALQKYVIVLAFLELGFDVFWFDFDSVWLKNPLPALQQAMAAEAAAASAAQRPEAMVFSAIDFDSKNCAMNAFFLLRQSQGPAKAWLLSLLDWIYKRPFVHDQLAFTLFLGVVPLVDEEPVPAPPQWAPLDRNLFSNALRFQGLGFSSEVDDLVLFHFFDGWNSNSPEGVEQWATPIYRGMNLFDHLYASNDAARQAIAKSKLPEPKMLRDCAVRDDFGNGITVFSQLIEVPTF